MKILREISFEEVIGEWLEAEQYKIPGDPTLEGLENMRPAVIKPLRRLPVTWYIAETETEEDFNKFRIVQSSDWEECTGGSYNIASIPDNIHLHTEHYQEVLSKKDELEREGSFISKMIAFGGSIDEPTIIEGNHRAAAYKLLGEENGYAFLPLQIIIGLSPESHRFCWCWDYQPPLDESLYQ